MSIGENYLEIVERKNRAAVRSGRNPEDVLLLAVTKLHTVEELDQAISAGATDVGENRVQELLEKYDRTDTMMILSINRDEAQVKMTSIMRDTWVELPGTGKNNKINAANVFGGPELAVETVNANFGTDIEDYVIVNMEDLLQIVDLMGGVDIEITESERVQINKNIEDYISAVSGAANYDGDKTLGESGLVHLNGMMAVGYCRIRKIDSDYTRVMRQQTVLLALAEKAQNMEVEELTKVAGDIYQIINTSLSEEDIKSMATAFMVMEVSEVGQNRIPADGTFQSGIFDGIWMIKPDLEKNREQLHTFIYGE